MGALLSPDDPVRVKFPITDIFAIALGNLGLANIFTDQGGLASILINVFAPPAGAIKTFAGDEAQAIWKLGFSTVAPVASIRVQGGAAANWLALPNVDNVRTVQFQNPVANAAMTLFFMWAERRPLGGT